MKTLRNQSTVSSPGNSQGTALRRAAVLAVPFIAYLLLALVWQGWGFYPLEGDEGPYVQMVQNLISRADFAPIGRHRIGLPLILVPGYLVGGVPGAELSLVAIAGLFPLVGVRILRRLGAGRWTLGLSVLIFAGFPYLFASNQIFPDLVSGLLLLAAAERLLAWEQGEEPSVPGLVGFGLLLAYLPWLHLKNIGALVVLLGCFLLVRWRSQRRSVVRDWIPVAVVGGSLLLTVVYNQVYYRNMVGPWGVGSLHNPPFTVLVHLLGLHWDQALGLFWHQPLYLGGLVGLGMMIRDRPGIALAWGLLYLSILVTNCAHGVYGGLSLYGRFHWSVVSLWLLPMGYALRERPVGPRLMGIALVAVAGYELFLSRTLLVDGRLYYRYWLPDSLFPIALWKWLPRFADPDRVWLWIRQPPLVYRHLPNYVVVLVSLLLVGLGLRSRAESG